MDKASRAAAKSWWTGKIGSGRVGEVRNARDERKAKVHADHGEPERVTGQRADRRARRTQTVVTTWYGGTKVIRNAPVRNFRDRGSGRR